MPRSLFPGVFRSPPAGTVLLALCEAVESREVLTEERTLRALLASVKKDVEADEARGAAERQLKPHCQASKPRRPKPSHDQASKLRETIAVSLVIRHYMLGSKQRRAIDSEACRATARTMGIEPRHVRQLVQIFHTAIGRLALDEACGADGRGWVSTWSALLDEARGWLAETVDLWTPSRERTPVRDNCSTLH